MPEKDKKIGNLKPKLDFSFLIEIPEEQLMDINGAMHLVNHFWDHRGIPGIDINDVAKTLNSTSNEIEIAQRIVDELEKVGGRPFVKLSQDLINKEVVETSGLLSARFVAEYDREDPDWRAKSEKILQEMRDKYPV
jgi:hypothetical protein